MAKFTPINEDLKFISALPDKPRLENGYTASLLKSIFDKASQIIKEHINSKLIPELESTALNESGGDRIGCTALGDEYIAETVRGILSELKGKCSALDKKIEDSVKDVILGSIADGSITEEKLSEELAEKLTAAARTVMNCLRFTTPGEHTFIPQKTGLYRISVQGAGGGGTLSTTSSWGVTGNYNCLGGPAGAFAEVICELTAGEVFNITIGQGGEGAGNSRFDMSMTYTDNDYYNNYEIDESYSNNPGGESSFGNASGSIICPGGDRSDQNNYPVISGIFKDSTLMLEIGRVTEYHSGPSMQSDYFTKDSDYMRGCSSHFGYGGGVSLTKGKYEPSYGAGGCGGLWRHEAAPETIQLTRKSDRGGDGIVIIEYIG